MKKNPPIFDLCERAKFGDAFSQTLLGFLFERGLEMPKDKGRAEEEYRRASEQDFNPGTLALALLLAESEYEDRQNESLELFKRAADLGYAPAQFLYGCLYQEGELVKPDGAVAVRWIEAAARQKYAPAVSHLSTMYSEGLSVKQNRKKSIQYLREAAKLGDSCAEFNLGFALLHDEDIDEADRVKQGLNWIWKAANQSNIFANGFLAQVYREGLFGASIDLNVSEYFESRSRINTPGKSI